MHIIVAIKPRANPFLALMSQLFAPTTLRITFETEGLGKIAREEIEEIAVRDASGTVVGLRLPKNGEEESFDSGRVSRSTHWGSEA